MIIELANKFHTPLIIEMLKEYRSATPVALFAECDDEEYIKKMLAQLFAGRGFALIATRDNMAAGMVLGIIDQSIWDSQICILRELAYWVKPEYRGTSAGYRLLLKYNEYGKSLIDAGRVQSVTISKMVNSPDLDYAKFGYSKVEETWSMN
jgi:RimJ/RimL family protein N-acetyltransferase